jgi:hypothetical protein
VFADNLIVGDRLKSQSGSLTEIKDIEVLVYDAPITVYNFEVKGFHTYFVSDGEVLVHNNGCTQADANKLGFKKTNYRSHKQPVYKKGNKYIFPDIGSGNGSGSHNGGVWKMANSVKNLSKKSTRMGTYDKNLNRIGD